MAQYYYLVTSLPTLNPESDYYPTIQDFRQACLSWLVPEHRTLLDQAIIAWPGTIPDLPVLKAWYAWERGLRNALAAARAGRKQLDPKQCLKPDVSGDLGEFLYPVIELARAAMAAENPFKAEETVFWGRWRKLDDLEQGHFFDLDKVLVYSLKLQHLIRWKSMTPGAGSKQYHTQYESIHASFPLNAEAL